VALGLEIAVDEGGVFGADLGVQTAPSVIALLDREVVVSLEWPFGEDDILHVIEILLNMQRAGPWLLLGERLPLRKHRHCGWRSTLP